MSTPASGAGPEGQRHQRSVATRSLRTHPDLKRLKRQAKELLVEFQAGDAAVIDEVHSHYHGADRATFALHDAQLVIARAYGLESWPKLVEQAGSGTARDRSDRPSARLKQPFAMAGREWRRESVIVDGDKAWATICSLRRRR